MGALLCNGEPIPPRSCAIDPIIILGLSGSGKSTFTKQLKMVHEELTQEEVSNVKNILLNNVLTGLKEMIKIAEELKLEINSTNLKHVRWITSVPGFESEWDPEMTRRIKDLWKDDAIQEAYANSDRFDLQTIEHLGFIMEKLDNVLDPSYVPQRDEILRARQRTTGFSRTKFGEGKYEWTLVDVGGQLPERRKWDDILSKGAVAFIYFVAVDEFNTTSREDKSKTRLELSVDVFKQVINNELNYKLCPILFFNKMDRFKTKIEQNPTSFADFQKYFPEYKGGKNSEVAIKTIEEKFRNVVITDKDRLQIYRTCALDGDLVKMVFKAVSDHILVILLDTYL